MPNFNIHPNSHSSSKKNNEWINWRIQPNFKTLHWTKKTSKLKIHSKSRPNSIIFDNLMGDKVWLKFLQSILSLFKPSKHLYMMFFYIRHLSNNSARVHVWSARRDFDRYDLQIQYFVKSQEILWGTEFDKFSNIHVGARSDFNARHGRSSRCRMLTYIQTRIHRANKVMNE